jgi:hypothetical protein
MSERRAGRKANINFMGGELYCYDERRIRPPSDRPGCKSTQTRQSALSSWSHPALTMSYSQLCP